MVREKRSIRDEGFWARAVYRHSLVDLINLFMVLVLSGFALFALPDLPQPAAVWALYLFLILTVESGAFTRGRYRQGRLLAYVLFSLTVVFLFTAFESLALTLSHFNSHRFDWLMASADRALLGVDPTVFLEKFAHPVITEVLYVLYAFYFPMPIILMVWMLAKGRLSAAEDGTLRYLVCYYGAYVIYFFVPVRGPRFYLAPLQGEPLTGLLLSEPIRRLINLLEPNKLDAFPSLHAAILLVTLILAFRENRTMFRWFSVLGAGIVVSLVYLRYHYLIDVLAGLLWGAVSWKLGGLASGRFGSAMTPHYGEEM